MSRRTLAPVLLLVVLLLTSGASAHVGGEPGSGGPYEPAPPTQDVLIPRGEAPCRSDHPEWRNQTTRWNVTMQASDQCNPDDPRLVAAFVKGTNNVPQGVLDEVGLHQDAVVKGRDLDGDGDPDEINITLEISELNGWHLPDDVLASEGFAIAPGIAPAMWTFNPKTTIHHAGDRFFNLVRLPSVPIRVEVNDTVRITVENTHYFPHTAHLHGTDHSFTDGDGEGNDGVPMASERPILPGQARTYELTPRFPGINMYHCHVQPQVHVAMGLSTIIIVEEERANNTLQTFNVGGGHVRSPSTASQERYDREYDLVYQDMDKELSEIVQSSNDPRVVAQQTNREYDATDRDFDYFLLNGRSFPYTLRESVVVVDENEEVRLNVINAGESPISLHTHGHKPTVVELDGAPLSDPQVFARDVHTLTAAQRMALVLNTTDDGLHSYGPGLWFMHDHQERSVTTDGIGPGGDITVIAYPDHLDNETRMPVPNNGTWDMLFNAAYYRGEVPVWHDLGLPFLGQVADQTQLETTDTDRPTPGPAPALLAAVLVVLALALARREERP